MLLSYLLTDGIISDEWNNKFNKWILCQVSFIHMLILQRQWVRGMALIKTHACISEASTIR